LNATEIFRRLLASWDSRSPVKDTDEDIAAKPDSGHSSLAGITLEALRARGSMIELP
jgi:hypothetical protein